MWTTQTSSRDNWERLVAAVIKRQQIWQLCHQDSITTVDSEFSQRDLRSFLVNLDYCTSNSNYIEQDESFSVGSGSFAPSPQLSPARSQAMKYGSRAISKNLFSTLLWRKKSKNHGLLNIPEASRFASNSSAPSNISIPSYSAERSEAEILSSPHVKAFSFNELKKATRNFRPDSLVGKGGFGYVFKGWIEEHTHSAARPGSGSVIAVKKLGGGFHGHKEWLTQVKYLGQLHHPNLVQLIGYCCDGDNRLLVYEFMPRGSLENHLFRGPEPLSWATRIKVALGAARGLSFLHEAEHQVVHRNVNASNILLDGEFNSKLGGFGSARAGPVGDSTHVSTRVMGTSGYAAPEYVAPDRLTAKSDVYSFGVMLLELLSGRRAFDKTKGAERNLVDWAKPYMNNKRRLFGMMDLRLDGQYSQKEAYTAVTIAVQCLSQEAKLRPRMAEVVLRLERLTAPKSAATGHNQGSIEIYDRNTRKERKDLESNYRD